MTEQYARILIEGYLGDDEIINTAIEMAGKALEEIQQYRAIGTPEECRVAMEKQKSKNPIRNDKCTCPSCDRIDDLLCAETPFL